MDPRTERTRRAAHAAAMELLAEGGIAQLTPQNLARTSRLGRTTVYRHWPTTPALVLDLLKTFRMPKFEVVEGDLRARIAHNVGLQHRQLLDPAYGVIYRAVQDVALDDDVRAALLEMGRERVQTFVELLLPEYDLSNAFEDVTNLLALINGPLLQLSTFTGASSPRLAPAVVESVLAYLEVNCASGDPVARASS